MVTTDTRGRRLLRRALMIRASNANRLATLLGCKQLSVSRWLAGTARPESHYRRALERILRIPQRSWETTAESRAVRAAYRRAGLRAEAA